MCDAGLQAPAARAGLGVKFPAQDPPGDMHGMKYVDRLLWREVFSGDVYGRNYGEML